MENLEAIRISLLGANNAIEQALSEVDALREQHKRLFKAQRDHEREVEALRRDRDKFEQETRWLERLDTEAQQQKIAFRVEGSIIETTRKTLLASPNSMLAAWFSGRHSLRKNENGEIFLDRDPAVFSCLLDYLRCGCSRKWEIPPNVREGRLREEFDFFCVPWPFSDPLPGILRRENADWDMTLLDNDESGSAVLCLAADENWIVSGGIDQVVEVWDMRNFEKKWSSPRQSGPVCCVAIHGNRIAGGFSNGDVIVFAADNGKEEAKFFREENRVNAVAMDGRAVAASVGGTIYVWDIQTKGQICVFEGYDDIDRFGFYDQMLVLTSNRDVCFMSLATGERERVIAIGTPHVLAHRVFPMPDRGLVMVAYENYEDAAQVIYYGFFDVSSGDRVSVVRGESIISYPIAQNCVCAVDVSQDAALVVYECAASETESKGGVEGVERTREIRFRVPLDTGVADVCVVGERIVCGFESGKVAVVKPK